jgi:CHAT domain-containing protein/uncharacterized protein HemY
MKKFRRLIFCCLILLIHSGSRSAIPAGAAGEPIESLITVQSRREALARLIAERDRLLQTSDRVSLVKVSNQIAEIHLKLCDLDSAVTSALASLEVARQFAGTTDATLLVDTLTLSGRSHIRRNEIEKAQHELNEALQLSRSLKYNAGEAESLAQIAVAQFELGRHSEAEQTNNQAIQIWQQLKNQRGEAQALSTQGIVYLVLDQVEQATATLKNAEALWRSLGDSDELANTLVDQNFLAIRQGQWQAALTLLNEAQGLLVDKQAEPYVAGKVAMSLGDVYEAYGQLDTSLSYFQEALTLYRDFAHDKRAINEAANQVGRLQARLGDYAAAKQEIEQALSVALETGNEFNVGMCHETLGRVWLEASSYEPARDEFLAAISHFQKSNTQWLVARAQTYLGQTEHLLGHLERASEAYEKALRFYQKNPDYTNEAAIRFGLGKIALQQNQLGKAEEHLRRSITLTEQLRENAASRDLRSSFLALIHDRYETYVEWLMTRYARERNQQFAIEAFEANESGRARALLDSLRDSQKELRQTNDPLLLEKEQRLQQQEQQLIDERGKLASHGGNEKEKADVEKKLTDVRGQLETTKARINSSSNFHQLLEPLTYEDIHRQVTDAETSLLSYSLGDGKSFAWLVTQDGLTSYELADKQTIEKAATRLIALLKSPPLNSTQETELQSSISEVSRLVLEQVSAKLRTPRLIVIADGALQYIPFQILKNPAKANESLISEFDIVAAPSASALALVRQQRANRQHGSKLLVGFGDAVFSRDYTPQGSTATATDTGSARSETVSRLAKLPRLFNAKRELLAISDLVGKDSSFYVEYNATRANLLKLDLSQYRILHVVTHGVLDTKQPELSGIVLSLIDANQRPIDGFVSLSDIYRLRAPVDLVVLSACETAVGQRMQGEGLIGLTRGFMYAGASGVVATLWTVDDRATAELMKQFYANMLQRGMGPARALREAQNYIRSQPNWSAPYFWAGFTFQGDYDLTISVAPVTNERGYLKLIAGVTLIALLAIAAWLLWRRLRLRRHPIRY